MSTHNGSNGTIIDGGKAQPVGPPTGPEKFQPETSTTQLQTVVISNNSKSSSNMEATVTTALLASDDTIPVNDRPKISGTMYFRVLGRQKHFVFFLYTL